MLGLFRVPRVREVVVAVAVGVLGNIDDQGVNLKLTPGGIRQQR